MNLLRSLGLCAAFLIGGVGIGLLIPVWLDAKPQPSVIAPSAKEVEKVVWKVRECPGLKIAPESVRKELGVPEAIHGDVVAAVRIPGDERPHTVSGVYSPQTMAVTLLDRADQLPWLTVGTRYEVGVSYLTGGEFKAPTTALDGRLGLFQIKALHGGLVGQIGSDGSWQAGARAWISW